MLNKVKRRKELSLKVKIKRMNSVRRSLPIARSWLMPLLHARLNRRRQKLKLRLRRRKKRPRKKTKPKCRLKYAKENYRGQRNGRSKK